MLREGFVVVQSVIPGSIAEEAGVEPGDSIISINGEKVKDIFDYRYLITNYSLLMEVQKPDGEVWEIDVEKDEYDDLGLEFENSMIDDAQSCTNQCIFCFIDQMPKGMRETLYFKDDDSRLSFLSGNYVTLTNMKDEDLDRIIKYRMSPINVSVHTTNPELRISMLNNRFAGNVLTSIKKLVDGGITVNCQIVLCRGVNDGKELDNTISELSALHPGVRSVSIVPVGITRYREGLKSLQPYDCSSAMEVTEQVQKWQKKFLEIYYTRIVYIADEFYIMAGLPIPPYEAYEDFPQIENGVGLVAMLKQEFDECLGESEASVPWDSEKGRSVSIATGVSAYAYIREMAEKLEGKYKGLKVYVYDIKNEFFGENVTVTGLLTGRDIISQLKDKELGEELLLCRCMFRAGEELFLDDCTLDRLEKEMDIKASIVENEGQDFIEKILGRVK